MRKITLHFLSIPKDIIIHHKYVLLAATFAVVSAVVLTYFVRENVNLTSQLKTTSSEKEKTAKELNELKNQDQAP